jgi:hypothetical protein
LRNFVPLAHFFRPGIEAALGVLESLREFTVVATEHIDESIRALEEGWADLRNASTPEDFSRIAGRMSYTATKQWADSAQRVTKFMQHANSRHMRAGAAFAPAMPRTDQRTH